MRKLIADGLVIAGICCLVAAGWMIEPYLGLGVLGAVAVILGVMLATRGNET